MQSGSANDWARWITQKYDEWRNGKYGNAASIAEFARKFGASHQVVLGWFGGTIPQKAKYINALVSVYGDEVYSVLGIVKPDEEIININQLDPESREILSSAFEEAGFPVNSEEDLRRVIKALEARGVKVTRRR